MPDSHAFDGDDEDDDTTPHNSSTKSQVPALPHLRPPPTPIRIPNWSNSIHRRPNQKKLTRSNSLLATKVLASDAATNDLFPEIMTLSGSFRIIGSPLGKGVFADVCKVQSKTDERYYALKCQRQAFRGRKDRDIALAEVRCMLILQKDPPFSPYLLRFFKAWQEDERIHVVTELCCKDTCRQLLDKHPMLPEGVIWKLVYDVASGLSHMHAQKLVHNDIKPSNILLERNDGLGAICKIGDFGMTRSIDSNDDGQEGDQKYMAPELLQKSKLQASAVLARNQPVWNKSAWNQPAWNRVWNQPAWNKPAWNTPAWNTPAWNTPAWNTPAWTTTPKSARALNHHARTPGNFRSAGRRDTSHKEKKQRLEHSCLWILFTQKQFL